MYVWRYYQNNETKDIRQLWAPLDMLTYILLVMYY